MLRQVLPRIVRSLEPARSLIRTVASTSVLSLSSKESYLLHSRFFSIGPVINNLIYRTPVFGRNLTTLQQTVTSTSPSQVSPISLVTGRRAKSREKVLHQAQHHNFPRARAVRRRFKSSTRKLKLVCKLVRRARVDAALMQLSLTPKRAAKVVRQCIYDAKFNAANNHGMNPDNLLIDEIKLGRSNYLKRIEYKGRGRTGLRRKPFCMVAVYVREIRPEDAFINQHLARRRPRWKCGGIRS